MDYYEKMSYITKIREMCKTVKGRPLTVAVLGCVGVGKSSFINTIAAAMSQDRWREFAYSGKSGGSADPVTNFTKQFARCCQPDENENQKLPTLLDIAGFPENLDETWEKVMQMLFYGRIPEGENLQDTCRYLKMKNDDLIFPKYLKTYNHLKVDRIIVVCSAAEDVHEEFMESVMRAARPFDGQLTRSIPIFCAMTKSDMVDVTGDQQVKKRRQKIIGCLGLQGSEHRFVACRNYCSDVDPFEERLNRTLPGLDVPVLRFLTQVFDPVIGMDHAEENYPFPMMLMEYRWPLIIIFIGVLLFWAIRFLI